MKPLPRLLFVSLGFGAMGVLISLVPQKSARAAGAAPVMVVNTPTVNAQQSGAWNVNANVTNPNLNATVNGSVNANITNTSLPVSGSVTATVTNNLAVTNPLDHSNNPIALTIVNADESLRTPVGARCVAGVSAGGCTVYTVPAGSRLVIESLGVSITRINTGIHPSETFFSVQTNRIDYAEHVPLFQQGADAFGDYLTAHNTTRMYADPNSNVQCGILFDGPTAATNGVLFCELSGHLVSVPTP